MMGSDDCFVRLLPDVLRQIDKGILLICLLLPFTLPEIAAFPAIWPHFHALTKLLSQAIKSPVTD
jgi:ABC-type phosphate/phosphonate transport system permease subunit